jgi:uncharacterized membrane protein
MKINKIIEQVLKQVVIFILSYQLLFTNNTRNFIILFIIFLVYYILMIRNVLFIKASSNLEKMDVPNEFENEKRKLNSFFRQALFIYSFIIIAVIIFRYPFWIRLFR